MDIDNMQLDKSQKFDIELERIVPEYYSKNPVVRWLFNKRLHVALGFLKSIDSNSLIDVGCGNGYFIKLINESGIGARTIWGIDLNPNIIHLNDWIENSSFKIQDILRTDFQDRMFDVAVCLDILEHIRDVEKAVAEIRRILGDNGHLIISAPVESVLYRSLRFLLKGTCSECSGPGAGKHYYNAGQLDRIIRRMGFDRAASKKIPFYYPFDLFHLNLYKKQG